MRVDTCKVEPLQNWYSSVFVAVFLFLFFWGGKEGIFIMKKGTVICHPSVFFFCCCCCNIYSYFKPCVMWSVTWLICDSITIQSSQWVENPQQLTLHYKQSYQQWSCGKMVNRVTIMWKVTSVKCMHCDVKLKLRKLWKELKIKDNFVHVNFGGVDIVLTVTR